MGAVTYPDQTVISFLNEFFVILKYNTHDLPPDGRAFVHEHRLLWEPGFVVLSHRGAVMHRTVGYLPPSDLMAMLSIALGKCSMADGDYAQSADFFTKAEQFEASPEFSSEAIYWRGIAVFRREGRSKERLQQEWASLHSLYPESRWAKSADVFQVPCGSE